MEYQQSDPTLAMAQPRVIYAVANSVSEIPGAPSALFEEQSNHSLQSDGANSSAGLNEPDSKDRQSATAQPRR